MSRIGRKPVLLDKDVKVSVDKNIVHVEGPAGTLDLVKPKGVKLTIGKGQIVVGITDGSLKNMHGLFRSLLQNAVTGVKKPWVKTLELSGVGFRAKTLGRELILNLGFSHPVKLKAPKGISFQVIENKIKVSGVDKYLVGEEAASIRRIKKPEPYKGKGIRYEGEYIRKKLGKAAKAVGGAPGAK